MRTNTLTLALFLFGSVSSIQINNDKAHKNPLSLAQNH